MCGLGQVTRVPRRLPADTQIMRQRIVTFLDSVRLRCSSAGTLLARSGWHTSVRLLSPACKQILFLCAFICHFELELVAGLLRVLIARGRPVLCQFALGVRVQKTMTLYGFCRIGLWLYCVG